MTNPPAPAGDSLPGGKSLRQRVRDQELIVAPGCIDALTARIIHRAGFQAVYLGGYVMGASTCVSEPLLTLSEVAYETRKVSRAVPVPVIVDAGAGYGGPLYVRRTISELLAAGAAGIQIEDQVFPKEVRYHKGVERTISVDEMTSKLVVAASALEGTRGMLIARTDTIRTHGISEALDRIHAYADSGADLVMVFPDTKGEAMDLPRRAGTPLAYVNSVGNRFSRPILSFEEARTAGYRLLVDAITPVLLEYAHATKIYEHLMQTGYPHDSLIHGMQDRDQIEELLELNEMYELEERSLLAADRG